MVLESKNSQNDNNEQNVSGLQLQLQLQPESSVVHLSNNESNNDSNNSNNNQSNNDVNNNNGQPNNNANKDDKNYHINGPKRKARVGVRETLGGVEAFEKFSKINKVGVEPPRQIFLDVNKNNNELPLLSNNSQTSKQLMSNRRRSVFDNPQGEAFKITDEQKEKLDNNNFLMDVRREFARFGTLNYNGATKTLAVVTTRAQLRDEAIRHLETYIGSLSSNLSTSNKGSKFQIINEVTFPLTDQQIDILTDVKHLNILVEEIQHFGTINVDVNQLILRHKPDVSIVIAIHKLEKRLGILFKDEEIMKLMEDMNCPNDDINDVNKRQQFLSKMMTTISKGARFTKHRKRGQPEHRWILINNDRLFWKKSIQDRNHKSHSLHLTKILQIVSGKQTSALKTADNIAPELCFSVVAKKVTLDLSFESEEMCQQWIFYLRCLQRHFVQQSNEQKAMPNSRRFSAIGVGFGMADDNEKDEEDDDDDDSDS